MHEPRLDPTNRTSLRYAALAGITSAAVALGVGELVTGVDPAGTSLVSVVGDEFIDRFAGPLKSIAIALFGTKDKVALVVGIVVVALAIGASLGRASIRRPWVGPAGLTAFGLIGAVAYGASPLASAGVGVVASGLAALTGIGALVFLLHLAPAPPVPAKVNDGVRHQGRIVRAPRPAAAQDPAGSRRRDFLGAAALLSGGAIGLAALGRRTRGEDPSVEVRATTELPEAATLLLAPTASSFDVAGLTPYITPNDDFYRIDTAITVPRVDVATWTLGFQGHIDSPFTITYDELLAMDSVEEAVTLQCVSNEVGGYLVGNAVWQGVPLRTLLDRAGVQAAGEQVVGVSVDGFTAGFPTALLDDDRTALVAYAMNGELLPDRHGFPARLVVAGIYGYVSAVKWLDHIELTRLDEVDGFWVPRGWAKDGPIKTASRIDVPRAGQQLTAGRNAIAGVAWNPTVGISSVEVQVDDGDWMEAELGDSVSDETWVQWYLAWDAPEGEHVLTVRAIDADGNAQIEEFQPPAPDGATGLHARRVTVAA